MSKTGVIVLAICLALCGALTSGQEARNAHAQQDSAQVVTSGPDQPAGQDSDVDNTGHTVPRPADAASGKVTPGASAPLPRQ